MPSDPSQPDDAQAPLLPQPSLSDAELRQHIAAYLHKQPEEVPDADVAAVKQEIEAHGHANAAAFLEYMLDLRHEGDDEPTAWKRVAYADRVLASMYFASLKSDAGATPDLFLLGIRYALDPLTSFAGQDIRLFQYEQATNPNQRVVRQFPSRNALLLGPGAAIVERVVTSSARVLILDCVLLPPQDLPMLQQLLLRRFGQVPRPEQALEEVERPDLWYEEDGQRVRLWIGNREVPLPDHSDVNKLLRVLIHSPRQTDNGRQLADRYSITNASQAAGNVRQALNVVQPGAGAWLETNPICWISGLRFLPRPRT